MLAAAPQPQQAVIYILNPVDGTMKPAPVVYQTAAPGQAPTGATGGGTLAYQQPGAGQAAQVMYQAAAPAGATYQMGGTTYQAAPATYQPVQQQTSYQPSGMTVMTSQAGAGGAGGGGGVPTLGGGMGSAVGSVPVSDLSGNAAGYLQQPAGGTLLSSSSSAAPSSIQTSAFLSAMQSLSSLGQGLASIGGGGGQTQATSAPMATQYTTQQQYQQPYQYQQTGAPVQTYQQQAAPQQNPATGQQVGQGQAHC